MKRAQLVIFHPYKTPLRTDRKTATYPTAMRVCTFVRIEMGGEATEGHSDHENAVGDGAHYPPVCSHCGSSEPAPNLVAFDGLNIWLHRGCEVAWVNGVN
jgi:hypothetical protein